VSGKKTKKSKTAPAEVKAAIAAFQAAAGSKTVPADLETFLRQLAAALPAAGTGAGAGAGRAAAGDAGARPGPGPARQLLAGHRAVFVPFGWIITADMTALAARAALHASGPGAGIAAFTAVTTVTAAGIRTLVRLYRRRKPPQPRPSRRVRRRAAATWTAACAWAAIVIWWTPAGRYGAVQILLILGGLILGGDHLYRHRQQPRHRVVRGELEHGDRTGLPGPDPRLERFRARFITRTSAGSRVRAPLEGAELHSFAEVRDGQGFCFEITLDADSGMTYDTVVTLRREIGALYDVPSDQVLIDRGPRRSESRAQVTVLTAVDAYGEPERWDGQSTYDPATGCIDLGRFGDGQVTHARMHEPGSGTWGAIIVGGPGTGKTGDAHVLACEYGLAVLCAVCGAAGSCPACDPQRICYLIMCDPQRQPFSVWRGRADLTAWGPLAVQHVLAAVNEAFDERSAEMSAEEWTDAKGRTCHGRGWFDPTPQRPAVQMFIDEWPIVVASPGGDQAVQDAGAIEKERRKTGASVNWIAQLPDAGETGDSRVNREVNKSFNVIGHQIDGTSGSMVGITGKARDLPDGVYGVGYISGYDNRADVPFRTKNLPETAGDGTDVRDVADRIAATPVTLDAAVDRVFRRYGITSRGQVIDDEFVLAWRAEQARNQKKPKAGQPSPAFPRPAPAAVPGAGPVSTGTLDQVARALAGHVRDNGGQGAELYDVMQATGLAAGPAGRALAALAADGRARQAGPGTWLAVRAPEGATV
jgi:hypothetical protein